ncbi:6353_t:CDS:2, partial [Paraglomus brasilianum]
WSGRSYSFDRRGLGNGYFLDLRRLDTEFQLLGTFPQVGLEQPFQLGLRELLVELSRILNWLEEE